MIWSHAPGNMALTYSISKIQWLNLCKIGANKNLIVHAGVFEMLPNALLEVNEVIILFVLGRHSGLAMVVALPRGCGRYRMQLVTGGVKLRVVLGSRQVKLGLATSPSLVIALGELA
jgi:hypothetical protein